MNLAALLSLGAVTGVTVLLSMLSVNLVTILVLALAVAAGLELSAASGRAGTKSETALVGAAAGAFPLVVRLRGEDGLLETAAVVVVVMGAVYVLFGLRDKAIASLGASVMFCLLAGASISYLVLIGMRDDGTRLLLMLAVMVFGNRAAAFAVDRTGERPIGHALGAAVAVGAGLGLSFVVGGDLGAPELMILGAIVAGGASLSVLMSRMIRSDLGGGVIGVAFPAIEALLLSAPAFYYGVKLYLS